MERLLTEPIKFYRKHISPNTPPSCRFHPTCSSYALQAIEKHGAIKGGMMGMSRILRCNPFVEGGVDEVPDYFTLGRNPDNIDDLYIPEDMMQFDKEAQETMANLLASYEKQLIVSNQLPSAFSTLEQIVDLKELNKEQIADHFSDDELDYLTDIKIFPNLDAKEYQYYSIEETQKNKKYLSHIHPYFEETDIGLDFPIVVLEQTGIWYTNLPDLGRAFMIKRGVTQEDLENRSYHLWLVLHAIEEQNI